MKNQQFPAMMWHPITGEAVTVNSAAEVPDGYLDQHPNSLAEAEKATPEKPAVGLPMDRAAIVAALNEGEIAFKKNAPTGALYNQLTASLRDALASANVTAPDSAEAPELLEMVKALPPAEAPKE
jgi:hypothetical protein